MSSTTRSFLQNSRSTRLSAGGFTFHVSPAIQSTDDAAVARRVKPVIHVRPQAERDEPSAAMALDETSSSSRSSSAYGEPLAWMAMPSSTMPCAPTIASHGLREDVGREVDRAYARSEATCEHGFETGEVLRRGLVEREAAAERLPDLDADAGEEPALDLRHPAGERGGQSARNAIRQQEVERLQHAHRMMARDVTTRSRPRVDGENNLSIRRHRGVAWRSATATQA